MSKGDGTMKKSIFKKVNIALTVGVLTATLAAGGLAACNKPGDEAGSVPTLPSIYTFKQSALGGGKTYYVAPDGTSGGDGTIENPKKIEEVLTYGVLKPGDTVMVMPGTYSITEPIKLTYYDNGEYNNYITVKNADPTKKAVLDFSAMSFLSTNRGVQIDGDYWYWYGVDICGAGDNGMYIGGSYNVIENCEFYNNRDTGLQLGRSMGDYAKIELWPSYNLIKNCTSYNNYDNETYGENADGFAAKLTVGYGNIFDGCIAYRNSDDGWDLFAKTDSGNIGAVILYNCVAFENGYLAETQAEFHARFPEYNKDMNEDVTDSYLTRDGDGNGFKLGGSVMEGDVFMYNCLSYNNRMHGVTDNSNPGVLSIKNVTTYNNSAPIDNDPTSATFGQIVLNGAGIDETNKSGNINLARYNYSYNLMSNVLSIAHDSSTLSADEYRGAVEYSYFDMGSKRANRIEEYVDASNRAESYAVRGTSTNAVSADIFAKLPVIWTKEGGETKYTFNLSGKKNTTVHSELRNKEDGSINMGEYFKITDYSKLFGDEHKIGSDLNKTSWDAYTHYSYFNASNADSKEDAAVKSAIATLDINTNTSATFQDFDLIVSMEDVKIEWTSSNNDIIKIDTDTYLSPSGTQDARAIVYRQEEDKKVYLTAKVTHKTDPGVTMSKRFEITVKKDVPTIGEAVFADVEDGRIILDQFDTLQEPEMVILNAADYNGKILDPSLYTVETTVKYAENKNSYAAEIHHFSTNIAGVHTIYKTITMGESSKTFSYTIFVASSFADIDFVGSPSVMVNQYGYSIGGEVSSPTGKLYAYSSKENISEPTAEQVIANGQLYEFRNDKIKFQFENANTEGYFIYYVMTNLNDDVTSEVGKIPVTTVEIDDVVKFKNMLLNSDPSTIYTLTKDIDLSGETNWVSQITEQKKPFQGVLNGMGHTISGLKLEVGGNQSELGAMFYKVAGGTIENVNFKDINIKGNDKTGIVATTEGGFFYNISMENIFIQGGARVGGLIGQASTGELHLDQVSLVNKASYEEKPMYTLASDVTADNFADNTYFLKNGDVYNQAVTFETGKKYYMLTVTADNFALDIYYVKSGENYVVAKEYQSGMTYYTRRIEITGARSAGIIGFIQASKETDSTQTYLSNCYVEAVIGKPGEQYVGSIIGSADDRNVKDYLEINKSYSAATLYSKTYMGGILGSHNKGVGKLRINDCVFSGTLYYGNQKTEASQLAAKNCSGIVGRYMLGADAVVKNCYAVFADHNIEFDVDSENYSAYRAGFWSARVAYDVENRWSIIEDPDDPGYLKRPYVTLNFLGNWE